ncbi:hypothetical protein PGT21_019140 [Puccinia graminis f. sp. tritici]|uniref:Uncharacterized protein n=1 Tax=Puccinia graminis f. sp. tritici TaxID=56615 RepID=A0A5B0LKX7_PUCGR|nr:hypothetical protein PGT21_019140 [Puccinia graminis f. sp. tritici]
MIGPSYQTTNNRTEVLIWLLSLTTIDWTEWPIWLLVIQCRYRKDDASETFIASNQEGEYPVSQLDIGVAVYHQLQSKGIETDLAADLGICCQ